MFFTTLIIASGEKANNLFHGITIGVLPCLPPVLRADAQAITYPRLRPLRGLIWG